MVKTVVILGAGWAGLPLAHKLLKNTRPKTKEGLKVILVSPNSHFYWNLAAVRGIIPGAIPDEHLFLPIEPGFSQYSAHNFEFVLAKAKRIDPATNIVEVDQNDGTKRTLPYDQLVIATGSRIRSNLPLKPVGTNEETRSALHLLQKQVAAAESIAVAGAGPTGVEVAGELAAAYRGRKKITLIMSGEHVLQASNVMPSISSVVERDMQRLGVKLERNAQVRDVQMNTPVGKTTLTLSNGSTIVTDLYLPLFGVHVNTSFVPESLLDQKGNLNLDKAMRVIGTENVWGIGDVGNIEAKQVVFIDAQIIHLSATLDSILTGANGLVKEYKPSGKKMIFITMGKKHATGQIGGWRLWGWLVAYVKGRKLFVDTAEGYVGGKTLRHAKM